MNIKRDIRFRVYVAFIGICLFGVLILAKAAHIQQVDGPRLRAMADDMHLRTDTMRAERGNIYTEDGHLLCSSIPQFDLRVDFSVIDPDTFQLHVDEMAANLASILQTKSAKSWREELIEGQGNKKRWRYWILANNVAYDKYLAIKAMVPFNKIRRGGLIAEQETKRINPYGQLAFRTIGLYRENSQKIGLEATYDSLLQGENGYRVVQKMPGGMYMPIQGSETEARNGYDIVSTLDLGIQVVAQNALMQVVSRYECLNGTVVVMETSTGKVRALVNLGRQDDGSYKEDFNYAMLPSEPGSTFKITTLLSLLNDDYIKVEDIVNCEGGAIRFGPRVMRDSHLGLGSMTIRDAYAHSSNAAMAKLAFQHYSKDPEKYVNHLKKLHLDERTGIDIAGERRGRILQPKDKDWSGTTLPWMATGYGVMITPVHTCMIYNAIANGGTLYKPYLVSEIRQYGKTVKKIAPTVLEEHIASPEAIKQLQACTREVVLTGTGKHIKSPFYGISGKTGTAQVNDLIKGKKYGYKDGVYQGSFVGYFPNENPRYTICVVIRTKPHSGAYYGGTLAAPVFRMISDKIFSTGMGSWRGPLDSISTANKHMMPGKGATVAQYETILSQLGIPAANSAGRVSNMAFIATDSSRKLSLKEKLVMKGMVPDAAGLGLRDAVYLMEQQGLHVEVRGSGTVQSQSLEAGSRAMRGETINLYMN